VIIPEFTSQRELFAWIWDHRPRRSEISGKPLGNYPNAWFFAHCVPKGSCGLFKLKAFNIILMTPEEHNLYDHQTHKAKAMPEFNWVFEYRQYLTRKYYAIPNRKLYGHSG
jgi:hypothetical protein